MAKPIAKSLGVDVTPVRVHTGPRAQEAARFLSARAFALGENVFLGSGERPGDLRLMAHEVAHVVQQRGAPRVQLFTPQSSDPHEQEANRAAAAVADRRPFRMRSRTRPRIQRLGIGDALNYFAEKAYLIPGFRMFTLLIGVNPINMQRAERTAANIMRAIVEFLPGGALITQALDAHGVFDRVGAWVQQQLDTLGLTGGMFRAAIDRFLSSLGLSDLFHLGDVWERAKRIFTEPIQRVITFASGLIGGILRFIRQAVLRPLAALAANTRGYDLLKAVLGQDPVTGEPVPRTPETLIGGFMKLIGQEEVWRNLQQARAVPRAWAWFQGVLAGLLAYVRQIPQMFISALQQLEIADFVLLPRAFIKLGRVFGGFIGSFIGWAGRQVLALLEIIFEVLAPAVMPYVRRAMGAFRQIIQNPVAFIRNLVRAGIQGFRQFGANFLSHLRNSLIQWLTGTLGGTGIYIPQAFELREIIKFVLSVLGLTWQNIRTKLLRIIPEPALRALETGFDIVVTLVREGPAAAWDKIREQISNLREMVMEQIMSFVQSRIVQAAITRLVTSLNPAGAFIQAIIAIYNTVMFFVERLRQIGQVAAAFIDSISAIAAGSIGAAANRVEQTMAGLLTLVISFLARLVGLGRVSDVVKNVVDRIRAPIDRALDRVADWIGATARRAGRLVIQAGVPQDPERRLSAGMAAATTAVNALSGGVVTAALIDPVLAVVRTRFGFRSLRAVASDGDWWVEGQVNPGARSKTRKRVSAQGRAVASDLIGKKIDSVADFPTEYRRVTIGGKTDIARTGRGLSAPALSCARDGTIKAGFDLLRADYDLIDLYNQQINRIVADLGRALEGNPGLLPSSLTTKARSGRFVEANGVRAQMRRIIDVLQGPQRLSFRGVEVPLGRRRSADYTLTTREGRVVRNVIVEVKNWSTVRDAEDLDDKGGRLSAQLAAYIQLARTGGNDYSAIQLEWKGWTALSPAARQRFNAIINGHRSSAQRKGLTFTFIQI